jgi:glycosyltransferase involved in cell wall biosynthesis
MGLLEAEEVMRILIFNWRDVKHPWAGGAELYLHEIAKRFVKEGHQVTWFCGNSNGLSKEEKIDGIKIVRRGGKYSVYLHAFFYYVFNCIGKYDVIIDAENGIPFFTPLFSRKPKILLVHHVHKEVFPLELPKLLSWFLSILETKLMPILYKGYVVAVSESTKKDLVGIGFKEERIRIIYNGLDHSKYHSGRKSEKPMVIYLGRIKKYKRVDLLVDAFKIVSREMPEAELYIVGNGKKGREGNIIYTGFVSHEEKVKLLSSSWIFVNPSSKEGWGVSVIEANACGTPTVAFDVPGLRDSVVDGYTGLLVKEQSKEALAEAMLKVLKDERLRLKLSRNSLKWARRFSWDKSAREFMKVIEGVVNG